MQMKWTLVGMLCSAAGLNAAIKTEVIEYKAGDTTMKGFVAYDDAQPEKRPGIIVAPEWWGNNEYAHKRAEMLAGLGYVGFAIDLYGDGKVTTDPKVAGEMAGKVKGDAALGAERLKAAVTTLQGLRPVEPTKLAAIGYCFGGTAVLNMARMNLPLAGVASFHGGLANVYNLMPEKIEPKVLILHGADDPFESPEEVSGFVTELKKEKADFQFVQYANAMHAFTNPEVDQYHLPGAVYNESADKRSWQALKDFSGSCSENEDVRSVNAKIAFDADAARAEKCCGGAQATVSAESLMCYPSPCTSETIFFTTRAKMRFADVGSSPNPKGLKFANYLLLSNGFN